MLSLKPQMKVEILWNFNEIKSQYAGGAFTEHSSCISDIEKRIKNVQSDLNIGTTNNFWDFDQNVRLCM